MLDQVAVWVQMVDYRVCILGCACCKYTYFVVPVSSNKQLFCHRPNVETDIANDVAIRRRDIDLDHRRTEWVRLLYTMDKCLIKIEQEKLRYVLLFEFHRHCLIVNLIFWYFKVLQEVDGLVDVDEHLHIDMTLKPFLDVSVLKQGLWVGRVASKRFLCRLMFLSLAETQIVVHKDFVGDR